jgi:hypothetical protein
MVDGWFLAFSHDPPSTINNTDIGLLFDNVALEADNSFCINFAVQLKIMHYLFVCKDNAQGLIIESVD